MSSVTTDTVVYYPLWMYTEVPLNNLFTNKVRHLRLHRYFSYISSDDYLSRELSPEFIVVVFVFRGTKYASETQVFKHIQSIRSYIYRDLLSDSSFGSVSLSGPLLLRFLRN